MSVPNWWHGLWPPNNAASTIRDGWFGLLGSTKGFPYNAGIFFLAYLYIEIGAELYEGSLPLPTLTVSLLDSTGAVAGTGQINLNSPTNGAYTAIQGAFNVNEEYTLTITTPGQTLTLTQNGTAVGTLSGNDLSAQSSAPSIVVRGPDPVPAGGMSGTVQNG
jgi:hypothetical protein